MEILSVARSYSLRGNHRHRESAKRRWYAYFTTNDGRFGRMRISTLAVAFYKARIKKRIQLVCSVCGGVFQCFHRNDMDLSREVCPLCASPVTSEEKTMRSMVEKNTAIPSLLTLSGLKPVQTLAKGCQSE